MIKSDKVKLGMAWALLLIAIGLLYFRIILHSDSLFLNALSTDLFRHHGYWSDWRLTPAPAYVPDMLLYFIGYWIMPDAVWRIFFVTACQAVILTFSCLWLARTIRPTLSVNARASIILMVAFVSLVSACSGMWFYFNACNNHFASLLFAVISLGLFLYFLERPKFFIAALIVFLGGIAKASSAVFLICFVVPVVASILIVLLVIGKKDWKNFQYKKRLIALLGLLATSQVFAWIIDKLLTYHDPLRDRVPESATAAANSFSLFLQATQNAFLLDNYLTFIFSLLVALVFVFLIYRLFCNVQIQPENLIIKFPKSVQRDTEWKLVACGFLLIVTIPLNIFGAILSGGFVDLAGYRYFMFPIALALVLALVISDRILNRHGRSKDFFVYGIALLILLGEGNAIHKIYVFSQTNPHMLASHAFASKFSPSHVSERDVATCISQIEQNGFELKAGIADYWLARGVSEQLPHKNPIMAVTNDLMPFFWMSTIGPMLRPENYPEYKYNFVVLQTPGQESSFDFTPLTVGQKLPKNYQVHFCAKANGVQVWTYQGNELDLAVKAAQNQFLFKEKLGGSTIILGNTLPGNTGHVYGTGRVARAPKDQAGYLNYGPYVDLESGRYRVTINYSGTVHGNPKIGFVDMGRFDAPKQTVLLYKEDLKPAKSGVATAIFNIPVHGLQHIEIRTWFGGRGELVLRSIKIEKINT